MDRKAAQPNENLSEELNIQGLPRHSKVNKAEGEISIFLVSTYTDLYLFSFILVQKLKEKYSFLCYVYAIILPRVLLKYSRQVIETVKK